MTGELVNLTRARKARARAAKRAEADARAALQGRTKAQRRLEEAEATRAATRLDAHRRADTGAGDDPA
ncbi:MAG: DUF4169 family protein [Alkalilacustris sp.]